MRRSLCTFPNHWKFYISQACVNFVLFSVCNPHNFDFARLTKRSFPFVNPTVWHVRVNGDVMGPWSAAGLLSLFAPIPWLKSCLAWNYRPGDANFSRSARRRPRHANPVLFDGVDGQSNRTTYQELAIALAQSDQCADSVKNLKTFLRFTVFWLLAVMWKRNGGIETFHCQKRLFPLANRPYSKYPHFNSMC